MRPRMSNDPAQPPAPSPQTGGAAPRQGYASVATKGLALTLASVGVNKGFTVIAQVVLGILLTPSEFGLVAIAVGISLFIQTFRDGGVRELLTQQPKRYDELEGSLFWLSGVINMAVSVALGLAGEVVARVYVAQGQLAHVSDLTTLVWIMAAAVPLGTPVVVLHAKLRIDLNFRALAWFTITSGIVRYGGQIALALLDFGPMSIVLPTLGVAIAETAYCVAVTGRKPWTGAMERWRWPGVMRQTIWVVAASTAAGVANAGYIVVVGLFVPQAELGVYFFAISLLMQIETLVGQSVVTVLFPIMARMQDDPARQGQAAVRVLRATGLLVAPMAVALGVLWPVIDLVVFQGKWVLATIPLLILGLFYPLRTMLVAVPFAALQAQGKFKEGFFLWLWNGVGLLVVSGLAAWALRDIDALAWAVGIFLAVSCVWFTIGVVHRLHVRRREVVIAMLLTPLIAAAVGTGCVVLDYYVIQPWLVGEALNLPSGSVRQAVLTDALIRGAILSAALGAAYLIAVRVLAAGQVREAMQVLPGRVRGLMGRALRL